MKKEKFNVTGMTCAACQANITRHVRKVPGVQDVNVSLLANQMSVTYDESAADRQSIIHAVTEIGYGASPMDENGKDHHGTTDARGCRYLVGPLDDVFVAVVVTRVLGHGGQRDHHVTLRHVQTLEAAQQVCQDEEHRRAWRLLSDTAKRLLQGAQVVEA